MIRYALTPTALAVTSLPLAVLSGAGRAVLVLAVGFSVLLAVCPVPTGLAAIALTAETREAHAEEGATRSAAPINERDQLPIRHPSGKTDWTRQARA